MVYGNQSNSEMAMHNNSALFRCLMKYASHIPRSYFIVLFFFIYLYYVKKRLKAEVEYECGRRRPNQTNTQQSALKQNKGNRTEGVDMNNIIRELDLTDSDKGSHAGDNYESRTLNTKRDCGTPSACMGHQYTAGQHTHTFLQLTNYWLSIYIYIYIKGTGNPRGSKR